MNEIEETEPKKNVKKIDRRLLYILPSVLALALAITSFAYQFGNQIIDLNNTCYTIFVSVPENMTDDDCIELLNDRLICYDISGFTIIKNTQGGLISNSGKLILDRSYQIALMNISRKMAYAIADDFYNVFGRTFVMIEETTVKVEYIGQKASSSETTDTGASCYEN